MLLSYFDNQKNGQVILFIHGTASSYEIWEKQYALLSESSYRLIGIDLRGHGKSVNPGGVCNIEEHINDLKETINHIKITSPLTIVGHSFGAVLALKFAEMYPELVEKLLLVSLPPRIPEILKKYYNWLLGKPLEFIKKKINLILKFPLKKRHKLAVTSDINIIRQIFRDLANCDFINSVPKVRCPVYFSSGRFDYVALKSQIKRLHNELPNSSYKVFDWASHCCMEDAPREFNKWILTALALPLIHHGINQM